MPLDRIPLLYDGLTKSICIHSNSVAVACFSVCQVKHL